MRTININEICEVELTKEGIEYLNLHYPTYYLYNFDRNTNILKIELWTIMKIFGNEFRMGRPHLFVGGNIRI